MPIAWREAAEAFERILLEHGTQPSAVTDVEAAWSAFADFLQTEIDGIEPAEQDGDGFIVQWGRHAWNDNHLSLSLTRQLAVIGPDDTGGQPELWQIDLVIRFDDEPALLALEPGLIAADTGFSFDPIGPPRAAALAEARADARRHALVNALWTTTPASSELTFEHVC